MIFLYHGTDGGLTKRKALSDLKKEGKEVTSSYDLFKDSLKDVLLDLSSLSLFGERKVVLVENFYDLTSLKLPRGTNKDDEKVVSSFYSYLETEKDENDLLLLLPALLNSKADRVKQLKKNPFVRFLEVSPLGQEDYLSLGYQLAKEWDKEVDKEALLLLYERSGKDFLLFVNTLRMLLSHGKHLTRKDVEEMVEEPIEDKAYECLSFLLKGNVTESLKSYRNVRRQGNEGIQILWTFVNQLRLMALVKGKSEEGKGNDEIAKEISSLGAPIKSGRVYYIKKDLALLSFDRLLLILSDLSRMEEEIKIDGDDVDVRMENFLLNFDRNYRKR